MKLSPDLKCKVWRDSAGGLRLRVAGRAREGFALAGCTAGAVDGVLSLPHPLHVTGLLPATGLVPGELLTITLPRAAVTLAAGGTLPTRAPREVLPDQVEDWQVLAEGIYKLITDQGYASEVVALLRRCGMVKAQHPEVVAWAKRLDAEDRASEGGA